MEGEGRPRPFPTRLRPLSLGLVLMGVSFSALGVALRDPTLLFLALPLLIAPLAAVLSLPATSRPLPLSWQVLGSGAEVEISGSLDGVPLGASDAIRLEIDRPGPILGGQPPELLPGETRLGFRIAWKAPYPLLESLRVPRAVFEDPLGLAEREIPLVGTSLPIERFPPEAARLGAVPLLRTTALPGEVVSRALGASGTFFGVRLAVPGDSPRRINWRASARIGRECVNEFRSDRTGDLLIVLDARPSGLGAGQDRALLSIGRAAAHGIARGFLDEKDRVGLAVFGEYLESVPLGAGRTHRVRLDRLLARAAVADVAGPPERLAVALRRAYTPGVSTLLITPLADEESFHLVPHLLRRGFPTFVLSPSPLPLLTPTLGDSEGDRALGRLMRLVRRARVGRAWEESPVLDWEDYWTLAGLPGLFRVPGAPGGRR